MIGPDPASGAILIGALWGYVLDACVNSRGAAPKQAAKNSIPERTRDPRPLGREPYVRQCGCLQGIWSESTSPLSCIPLKARCSGQHRIDSVRALFL